MEQYKPLAGVKVVELSLMVAAAACGRMMADWGADVIKLENTKGGDNFRKWPITVGAPAEDECNPLFDNLNANKRAISVDTTTDAGREIVYKLLADADIFVTNIRTAALRKQGLDYDTLKEKFPRLVMCQIDGYGEKGAESGRPGYDNTAFWARGGFLYSQSVYGDSPDTYPVYMPMGFGDTTCALGMMAAALAALHAARETGKGDRVSLSLYGTAAWLANILVSGSEYGFKMPKRRENSSPFGAPYKCSDGRWFMPQIVNFARDHEIFFKLLGCDDMIGDPRYASRPNFNKVEICQPVMERFEKIFATKTAEEWFKIFDGEGLCCEILYGYGDILTDPQAIENGFVYNMKYKDGREAKVIRSSLRSERMGLAEFNPGPMLGEHTASIMAGLGYSEDEINRLIEDKIVFQHA